MDNNLYKTFVFIVFTFLFEYINFAQYQDCENALDACNNSIPFTATTNGPGNVLELQGNNISNPGTNPNAAPGNQGCLLFDEENPTWIKISIVSDGQLEFTIGDGVGNDFYDWAMWANTGGDGCNGIINNTNAPVACNWNGAADSFTGMAANGNLPPGANQVNFEYALNVTAGQQFILCFSNFGGMPVDPTLNFFGSAEVSCDPTAIPNETICIGQTTSIDIPQTNTAGIPLNITNYSWSPAATVSDPNGGPSVDVTPTMTTTYTVTLTSADSVWTQDVEITVIDLVQPDAGINDTNCFASNNPYELIGTLENPANTAMWEYAQGPVGTPGPPNAIFLPNANDLTPNTNTNYPGLYQYVLHEIDNNGVCPDGTDTVEIFFAVESHSVNSTPPSCVGENDGTIEIISNGNLPVQDYSFDSGNTFITNNLITNATGGNNTDTTYTIISRNTFGCEFQSTVTITNPAPVTISITPVNDTLICENGTATLIADAQNGTAFNYFWDHTTDNGKIQTVSPLVNSTYSVYAQNEFGCESETVSTNVNLRPPITLVITSNDTICPNGNSTITVEALGGDDNYVYEWSENGNTIGETSESISVSPSENTEYCVTVTDGCETTPANICTNVIMREVPEPIFTTDTTEGCNKVDIDFYNITTYNLPETQTDSAIWLIEGQIYNDLDTVTHAFENVGIFDVSLQIYTQYGCTASFEAQEYIDIHPLPEPNFYVLPNPTTIFNTEVEMINNTDGDLNTYYWEFPNGIPSTSNLKSPEVLYPEGIAGQYPVQLTVTNEFNCVDSTFDVVQVISDVILYAPNAFTPDGDAVNNTWRVYIDGIDLEEFHLVMFNRWGEVVWESYNADAEWDGSYNNKIIDGTYVWKIITKDATTDKRYEFRGTVNILR